MARATQASCRNSSVKEDFRSHRPPHCAMGEPKPIDHIQLNPMRKLHRVRISDRLRSVLGRAGAACKPVVIAVVLGLAACSLVAPKFNRPNVSVVSIEMRNGNFLQQNFAVKLNIQNPNDRALPVSGLHVELKVDGEEIASGVSDRAFVVPALGESEFDMTIKANLAVAVLKLADRMNQHADSVDYDLTGAASIDLPFFHDLPFHQTGSFPLKGIQ
jgi:LEA14-like dessication related protein